MAGCRRSTASLVSPQTEPAPRWLASYPADVDWNTAIEPRPVYALLDRAVATWPDRIALDFMGRRTCYAELGRLVDRAAQGLSALGLRPDMKLGLFLPNCPYFVVLYYAALKTRGVPTALLHFAGEYHGTGSKPSNFMRTQLYMMSWYGRWRRTSPSSAPVAMAKY